jgi:hypothetical protein
MLVEAVVLVVRLAVLLQAAVGLEEQAKLMAIPEQQTRAVAVVADGQMMR